MSDISRAHRGCGIGGRCYLQWPSLGTLESARTSYLAICVLVISRLHLLVATMVFRYLASEAANPLTVYAFTKVLPYRRWEYNRVFWPIDVLLTAGPLFLISIFTGWLITRLDRSHKRVMVFTSFLFMCAVVAPPICRMLLDLAAVPIYFSIRGLITPVLILLVQSNRSET
jgi:hypothetical protein